MTTNICARETLEAYFSKYRQHTIGHDFSFAGPYGVKKLIYADWTASGRLYAIIEDKIRERIAPLVGNTHTEITVTGRAMTHAYDQAKAFIKSHVGADDGDAIICCGSGMTGAIHKLQRILGLKISGDQRVISSRDQPIVFVTHREHHSNHISWLETNASVQVIHPDAEGNVDLNHLEYLLYHFRDRKLKIASISACSNVTGLRSPVSAIAKLMHRQNGYCFVDYACSAPYEDLQMHPEEAECSLDAIFFSPHKFLGGPGTPGVLIFNKKLYQSSVPDHPGGGTVFWTDPWLGRKYLSDIEMREDGGTPPFLQTIKAALAMKLKEEMGVPQIQNREKELLELLWNGLQKLDDLIILESQHRDRIGIVSICFKRIHYNLAAKILNDRFGIQVRGGCACAGTYGHYLLKIDKRESALISQLLDAGDFSRKPGWVRISLHPTMTSKDIKMIIGAIEMLMENIDIWKKDYLYDPTSNEFISRNRNGFLEREIQEWYQL